MERQPWVDDLNKYRLRKLQFQSYFEEICLILLPVFTATIQRLHFFYIFYLRKEECSEESKNRRRRRIEETVVDRRAKRKIEENRRIA